MNKFEIQITLTFSKLMATLLLISGTWLSLSLNSLVPFTTVVPIIAFIIGYKQNLDSKTPKV